MKIDTVGANTPLIFESLTPDGIFEAGESWDFVVEDYFHTTASAPSEFESPGAVGITSVGPLPSASIIAIELVSPSVPTVGPAGLALVGSLMGLAGWRKLRS
jgi:hypothetical protein